VFFILEGVKPSTKTDVDEGRGLVGHFFHHPSYLRPRPYCCCLRLSPVGPLAPMWSPS